MNPLQRTIIEKTGNDNGFEHVVASDLSGVTLASAHHANRVLVGLDSGAYQVRFQTSSSALLPELQRSFPATQQADAFQVATEADLAAELAELPTGIAGTEVERMIRQRVGQNKFRDALMDYWGGACAVTGVAVANCLSTVDRGGFTTPRSPPRHAVTLDST